MPSSVIVSPPFGGNRRPLPPPPNPGTTSTSSSTNAENTSSTAVTSINLPTVSDSLPLGGNHRQARPLPPNPGTTSTSSFTSLSSTTTATTSETNAPGASASTNALHLAAPSGELSTSFSTSFSEQMTVITSTGSNGVVATFTTSSLVPEATIPVTTISFPPGSTATPAPRNSPTVNASAAMGGAIAAVMVVVIACVVAFIFPRPERRYHTL